MLRRHYMMPQMHGKAACEEVLTSIFKDHGREAQTLEKWDDLAHPFQGPRRCCKGLHLRAPNIYSKNMMDLMDMGPLVVRV